MRPKPRQLFTLKELHEREDREKKIEDAVIRAKALSFLPSRANGSLTSVTMTLAGNANGANNKTVMRALSGLAKLLKIDMPKNWVVQDSKGARDSIRSAKDAEPMDLLAVVTQGMKLCRGCRVVIRGRRVKLETKELNILTKQEKEDCSEIFFCDEDCYFDFIMKRAAPLEDGKRVESLDQLRKVQEKHRQQEKVKEEEKAAAAAALDGTGGDDQQGHKGKTYKTWTELMASQRKYKKLNENELTQMMYQMGVTMMPPREVEDGRECLFCHLKGDAPADGPARLLNYDVDKWVHLNCALWSDDVDETQSGSLMNVETALKAGSGSVCKICEKTGATVKCFKVRCQVQYHLGCAVKDRAVFYKNKSVFCNQHINPGTLLNRLKGVFLCACV